MWVRLTRTAGSFPDEGIRGNLPAKHPSDHASRCGSAAGIDTSNDPAVFPTEPGTGPYWLARCGNPDFLGRDPRGDW